MLHKRFLLFALLVIGSTMGSASFAVSAVGPPGARLEAMPQAIATPAIMSPAIDVDCLGRADPMTPVLFENVDAVACQPELLAATGRCLVVVPLAAIVTAVMHHSGTCVSPGLPPRPD